MPCLLLLLTVGVLATLLISAVAAYIFTTEFFQTRAMANEDLAYQKALRAQEESRAKVLGREHQLRLTYLANYQRHARERDDQFLKMMAKRKTKLVRVSDCRALVVYKPPVSKALVVAAPPVPVVAEPVKTEQELTTMTMVKNDLLYERHLLTKVTGAQKRFMAPETFFREYTERLAVIDELLSRMK